MALTADNWTLNTYTAATWTDLVAVPATVNTIIISNPTASPVSVSVRLEDAAANLSTVLPVTAIEAYGSYTLDIKSINVTGTEAIQVYGVTTGAEFLASGAV
jgi:hypothetical protein